MLPCLWLCLHAVAKQWYMRGVEVMQWQPGFELQGPDPVNRRYHMVAVTLHVLQGLLDKLGPGASFDE